MKPPILISALIVGLLGSLASHALNFTVAIDTSGLTGSPSAPFSLDFQLTDGSATGDANNTATITDFAFGGGTWTGVPTVQGGASALAGAVTCTDPAFLNEFFQAFTPGNSLSFKVSLTTAVDVGGTPDEFSFAILDSSLNEIPTLGAADAFVVVDLDSPNPAVLRYGSDLSRTSIDVLPPRIVISSIPEGSIPTAILATVWLLGLFANRRLQYQFPS